MAQAARKLNITITMLVITALSKQYGIKFEPRNTGRQLPLSNYSLVGITDQLISTTLSIFENGEALTITEVANRLNLSYNNTAIRLRKLASIDMLERVQDGTRIRYSKK